MPSYDTYTFNSKNPLTRYAHRSRLKIANQIVKTTSPKSILDFGCGDGNFLSKITDVVDVSEIVGFDPYMATKETTSNLLIYKTWDEVIKHTSENIPFEMVTCFEVMEHFSEKLQIDTLEKIKSVTEKDSTIIISVPIEKGIVSVVKNIRRVFTVYKGNEKVYSLKNIICSMIGIKNKEMVSIRNKDEFLPHMGFYFDELESLLRQFFQVDQVTFSPFPYLPSSFNSQVFFKLSKKSK